MGRQSSGPRKVVVRLSAVSSQQDHSQVGGGFHDLHGGPLLPQARGCGRRLDHGNRPLGVDDEVVAGEVGDGHVQ